MKKTALFAILGLLSLSFPMTAAHAADYLPKDHELAGNVVIEQEENSRNLYVGGGAVTSNQAVSGDLFIASGSANLNGSVEDDLMVAAGNVTVSAEIGGDARMAGGNISLNAPIAGDLLVGTGTLSIGEGASIGGDLWAGAGVITLNAPVAGNVKIAAGEIYINSQIDGSVELWAEESVVFGPNALISGEITYRGLEPAVVKEGAQIGTINFTEVQVKYRDRAEEGAYLWQTISIAMTILKLIGMVLLALILLKAFPKLSKEVVTEAYTDFWNNLGHGLVSSILFPLLSLLLVLTGLFTYVGVVGITTTGILGLVGGVFAILLLGSAIEQLFAKREKLEISWRAALWGALAGIVLAVIPVLGWIAMWIAFLAAFGATIKVLKKRLK